MLQVYLHHMLEKFKTAECLHIRSCWYMNWNEFAFESLVHVVKTWINEIPGKSFISINIPHEKHKLVQTMTIAVFISMVWEILGIHTTWNKVVRFQHYKELSKGEVGLDRWFSLASLLKTALSSQKFKLATQQCTLSGVSMSQFN